MKIKIICGTYGHRPDADASRVVRKDKSSLPFDLDDKEAQRLIDLGIAAACDGTAVPVGTGNASDNSDISEEQVAVMEYLDMKKLAKEMGVDARGNKEELRERLMQAVRSSRSEDNDAGNPDMADIDDQNADDGADQDKADADSNEPPMLEPQEPV